MTALRGRVGLTNNRRRIVGAGDRHCEWLGNNAAMAVIDGSSVGKRQLVARGEKVEFVIGDVIRPSHCAVVGVGARRRQRQRGFDRSDVRLLLHCQRRSDVVVGCVLISERREGRGHHRTIDQVGIGERHRAAGMVRRSASSAG